MIYKIYECTMYSTRIYLYRIQVSNMKHFFYNKPCKHTQENTHAYIYINIRKSIETNII